MCDVAKNAEKQLVVPERTSVLSQEDPPELNLRVLACLGRYLRDRRGEHTLLRVTKGLGLAPTDLDGKTRWISAERFEALLRAARSELDSDDEFFEACLYEYASTTQGLVRYLLTLRSPIMAYERGCQMFELASRVSTLESERLGNRKLRLVYKTTRAESRLTCLSRRSSLSVTPTLWGLPRAFVESTKCIAAGDDSCVYEITVYETSRWVPAVAGAGLGAMGAMAFVLLADAPSSALALLTLSGALVGQLLELYRVNRHNIAAGERGHQLLRGLAEDDSEARRELMELHQRQNEWLRLMEEQLAGRTAALQEVVQRVRELHHSSHSHIKQLSHDLRNPLQVMISNGEVLRQNSEHLRGLGFDVDEHFDSVRKIQGLMQSLMTFVTTEQVSMELAPSRIDVQALTDRMRRELRALARAKPIRLSVFRVREAPDSVVVDAMLLDRIVDNLLTNAVKYTDQGSIVIEVGGTPGFLTLKISDTGCGIEADRLETAFVSGATSQGHRASGSSGVGLSVVVDLLRRIDGRLEVMSKPNVGTTFWVHVPIEAREASQDVEHRAMDTSQILKIRKALN